MTTVHRRVGHQIAAIRFPRRFLPNTLTCSCAHKLDAPTPELLDVEWQAHRREVSDNDTARRHRTTDKVPGYTFGGRFE